MEIKLVFLCSGNGGNLKFIQQFFRQNDIPGINARVVGVLADRNCGAVHYAKSEKIDVSVHSFTRSEHEDQLLCEVLHSYSPDLIITTVHRVLSSLVLKQFGGKLINLHYSLLPAFAGTIGAKPVHDAIKSNCRFIGTTCHRVTEVIDGGPILSQSLNKHLLWKQDLLNKIFQDGCLNLLNGILNVCGVSQDDYLEYDQTIFSPSISLKEYDFASLFRKIRQSV